MGSRRGLVWGAVTTLLAACSFSAPFGIGGAGGSAVHGTVVLPSQFVSLNGTGLRTPVGYRVLDAQTLLEQAVGGAKVKLLSRDGLAVPGVSDTSTDGSGQFAIAAAPDGVYQVEADSGTQARLKTLVRVHAGQTSTTVLSVASTLVTSRVVRTRLRLTNLDQGVFDSIAAQARGLMTTADVPDLSGDAGINAGSDAYLASHGVIRQQIDAMLAQLAQVEGVGLDATATQSASPSPGPSAKPSANPHATPTPDPTPIPKDTNLGGKPLSALASVSLDGNPSWVANEGTAFVWVSTPNSINRLSVSDATYQRRYGIDPGLGAFNPAQIAIDQGTQGAYTVWVGNQHAAGTKVARYDVMGTFLGAVDVQGVGPSAIAVDADPSGHHVWVGVNGDSSGRLVVLDVQGNVLNAGTTAPHPFQMASWNYTAPNMGPLMWVATPRILYRLGARAVDIQQAGLGLSQGSGNSFAFDQTATNPLTGQPDGRLNHPIAAMSVTKPYGDVWLVLQDPGDPNATLLRMQPDSLVPTGIQLFATTAPVVSVLVDFQGNPRVATQRELIQFDGQNKTTFLSPYANAGRHILGMFQGFDFALWTAFDNPGQVVKLNP